MNLPDVNDMFPQEEPELWSRCIYCRNEIFEGEVFVEAVGYHYCDIDCYAKLSLDEGNIERRIAGD